MTPDQMAPDQMAPDQTATYLTGPVVVRTPATSANLGPGFDALGLALSLHDQVQAQVTESGLRIDVSGAGTSTASHGERHLVVRAMRAAFGELGGQPPGIALRCVNAIPHGFGLGSSAAAIVAGVLAARSLVRGGHAQMADEAVLALAANIEGHADNVAACVSGGLTIAFQAGGRRADGAGRPARALRLDPLPGLTPVLCVPDVPLATEVARQVLPATVPHSDAAKNAARSALLVAALTQPGLVTDPAVLLAATEDFLHQPYRAASMPATAGLIGALRNAGVPAVVSGAGPAVLALVVPDVTAGPDAVAALAAGSGHPWTVRVLEVDRSGAIVQL